MLLLLLFSTNKACLLCRYGCSFRKLVFGTLYYCDILFGGVCGNDLANVTSSVLSHATKPTEDRIEIMYCVVANILLVES